MDRLLPVNIYKHISFLCFFGFDIFSVSKTSSDLYVYSDADQNQGTKIYDEELLDCKSADDNDTLHLHELEYDRVAFPKIHNELYNPVAKRYSPPTLIQSASSASLLDTIPEITENHPRLSNPPSFTHSLYSQSSNPSKSCTPITPCDSNELHQFEHDEITPDILDVAIESVERYKLKYVKPLNEPHPDYRSPLENKRKLFRMNKPKWKSIYLSHPSQLPSQALTYKLPKINKGCLIERNDKYYNRYRNDTNTGTNDQNIDITTGKPRLFRENIHNWISNYSHKLSQLSKLQSPRVMVRNGGNNTYGMDPNIQQTTSKLSDLQKREVSPITIVIPRGITITSGDIPRGVDPKRGFENGWALANM